MKILILTTYYPPDTAIAAVRPYMFAKYLAKRGHEITVIRSGEFYDSASDFFSLDIPVRVITYLGENSPAERYARGELTEVKKVSGESRIAFLPEMLRKLLAKMFHALMRRREFQQWMDSVYQKFEKQKVALDALEGEKFDVVFSTYGQLENVFAGRYAAQKFNCKLIQDFRDALANREFYNKREYAILKKIQDEAAQRADVCTAVSEGLLREVCADLDVANAKVLYNGYEPVENGFGAFDSEKGVLSFCYTGKLYGGMSDFSPLLKALRKLSEDGRISLDKVRIHYAGNDFEYLKSQAEEYGVTESLIDHGHVGREEAVAMQNRSDLFVVLSWNTQKTQGVLTGKFYEGIRAKKPILALVNGDVADSELDIINRKYGYGLCYEKARDKEDFEKLCDFLSQAYREKMEEGQMNFEINPELEKAFRYDVLAGQLEKFCEELLQK